MRGITSSGRVYELRGTPGFNSDGEYAWNRWLAINSATDVADVTAEISGETPVTIVKKLIHCLQQNDPRAIVVLPSRYGVVRPLHIADVSAVALREHGIDQYKITDDDIGTPEMMLKFAPINRFNI